jgi:hypothetical protein
VTSAQRLIGVPGLDLRSFCPQYVEFARPRECNRGVSGAISTISTPSISQRVLTTSPSGSLTDAASVVGEPHVM